MGALLNLTEILGALAPHLHLAGADEVLVRGVSIDSRQVNKDYLFVALRGERRDGHEFVAQAFQSGACLALTEHPLEGLPALDTCAAQAPERFDLPCTLVVPDTLAALQQVAAAHRSQFKAIEVVGVTGSMGKTTAKEAIAAVLAQGGSTLRNAGNQNNEIGLPLTLLTMEASHRYAVLEMGMYALDEIALLCRLAQPRVGVVLNVAPIHLERLGSIERIAQAKAELVQALPEDGLAILNGDDPLVAQMAGLTRARTLTYGLQPGNMLWASEVITHGLEGISLQVHADPRVFPDVEPEYMLKLQLLGKHAAYTALAAAAVGLAEGLPWTAIQRGLETLGYGLRLVPEPGIGGVLILNDSYNANPSSTAAALDVLASLPGRHIAVLGDMLELGSAEQSGHRAVGAHAAATADMLITLGIRAREIAAGAREAGMTGALVHEFMATDEIVAYLKPLLQPEDVVLVKGSRVMAMEKIVQALQEPPQ
ncbi:MAG: UDP-N-acetylmuramoyl-tripeptide--D-alanyl-D-alanine ligase [Chloroflexi bacterium]|nr:UDP-N-acetylmuramoyl-tripeptide--D-alanyl-D-alanine ligase [Chloroflexota bacterium]